MVHEKLYLDTGSVNMSDGNPVVTSGTRTPDRFRKTFVYLSRCVCYSLAFLVSFTPVFTMIRSKPNTIFLNGDIVNGSLWRKEIKS